MLIIALLLALFVPYLSVIRLPLTQHGPTSIAARPSVAENGSDVVYIPFPTDLPGGSLNSLAFGSDGTAYFIPVAGEIASVSPTGVYITIPAPHAVYSASTIFAHGSLWTAADQGLVRVAASGRTSRWYQLNQGEALFSLGGLGSIASGPNGTVLAIGTLYNNQTGALSGELVSIGLDGVATKTALPGRAQGPLTFDSAGHLYFGLTPPNGSYGIARLETDGTVTIIPFPYPKYLLSQVNSMVDVHGTLYFTAIAYIYSHQLGEHEVGFFGKIPPNGAIGQIVLPGGDGAYVYTMSADFGGNLWLDLNAGSGYLLYGYDTYDERFSAPIEPALIDQIYTGPFTGPDDNIWTVRYDSDIHHYYEPTGFDVYVKHVQTLEPATLAIVHGQTSTFSILESHFNGPWTAQSLNPAIATVPATSNTGVFTVLAVSPGTTRITVKDHLGNFSYETITSN